MDIYHAVNTQLARIEAVLKACQQWQEVAPAANWCVSDQPFYMDMLQPCEWLQWVLIPRMRVMVADRLPLPENCAITPYFEMVLPVDSPLCQPLLAVLRDFDVLFSHQ